METYTFYGDEMDVRKTSMGKDPNYVTYYTFWSKILFMEAIPYVVIFVLNIIIVSKIFESISFRKNFLSTKQREDLNTCQYKVDQSNTKTDNTACDRGQSSPAISQVSRYGRNSISYSSSSNLVAKQNVALLRRSNPCNIFTTSTNAALSTKQVSWKYFIFPLCIS